MFCSGMNTEEVKRFLLEGMRSQQELMRSQQELMLAIWAQEVSEPAQEVSEPMDDDDASVRTEIFDGEDADDAATNDARVPLADARVADADAASHTADARAREEDEEDTARINGGGLVDNRVVARDADVTPQLRRAETRAETPPTDAQRRRPPDNDAAAAAAAAAAVAAAAAAADRGREPRPAHAFERERDTRRETEKESVRSPPRCV